MKNRKKNKRLCFSVGKGVQAVSYTHLILALTLGLSGIQMAQMVADLLTFLCSVPIQTWVLKKLSQPQNKL